MMVLDELFSGDDARAEAALASIGEAHLPDLARVLHGNEADARWWAVCALARIASPEAGALLLATAADPDPNIRAAALFALGERRAPEAITPLLFALNDESPFLTRLASDALIRIGPPAVPFLIRVLENDAQPQVRVNAARALALIGDKRAIPVLFKALEDESVMAQYWADEGLDRMGVGQVYFKPG